MAPLLDEEIDELDQFLLSGSASDETMSMSELDGYLTANVVGPKPVAPSLWLPGVWGPTQDDAPEFETAEQAQHILTLIMRHMNGIVWSLQHDPDDFDPLFNSFKQPGKHREYVDGEAWAYGFMQGIALTREDWQPLFDDEVMVHVLQPIHLLGSDDVTDDEDALTQTPAQREKIAETIAAAVAAVYRFWLPRREESDTVLAGAPNVRKAHKTGRNEPCPCGSGKKFKKCCGAARTLH
jgi:uncharacterized protein